MSESTALVRKGSGSVTDLVDSQKFAQICLQSGLFKDTTDLAKALLKISYGRALGIDEATAMTSINIIQGKLSLSGNLIAVRIKQSGKYRYEIRKKSDKECSIQFFEKVEKFLPTGQMIFDWKEPGPPETWTMQMAERAGLTRNPVWKSHPEAMLFNRCITSGGRTYCPEIFVGHPVYTPDELDPDLPVRVVDGELVVDTSEVDPPPTPVAVAKVVAVTASKENTLEDLKQLVKDTNSDLSALMKTLNTKTEADLTQGGIDMLCNTLRAKQRATPK